MLFVNNKNEDMQFDDKVEFIKQQYFEDIFYASEKLRALDFVDEAKIAKQLSENYKECGFSKALEEIMLQLHKQIDTIAMPIYKSYEMYEALKENSFSLHEKRAYRNQMNIQNVYIDNIRYYHVFLEDEIIPGLLVNKLVYLFDRNGNIDIELKNEMKNWMKKHTTICTLFWKKSKLELREIETNYINYMKR